MAQDHKQHQKMAAAPQHHAPIHHGHHQAWKGHVDGDQQHGDLQGDAQLQWEQNTHPLETSQNLPWMGPPILVQEAQEDVG